MGQWPLEITQEQPTTIRLLVEGKEEHWAALTLHPGAANVLRLELAERGKGEGNVG